MAEYRIQEETLTAIADRTREMAGTGAALTPGEIIYWLGRVLYIPQGWAASEFALTLNAAASGRNCSFEHSYATSTLSSSLMNLTATAVGTL